MQSRARQDQAPRAVRLDRSRRPTTNAPVLDAAQQRVVDHREGPLLVLAGPGTGKTTTLTEAIVARLTDPQFPTPPERLLALTFARKAAGELRDRVQARIGGGLPPVVATFHSFAYALLRTLSPPEEFLEPPRLLSGAEEDAQIRDLLLGSVAEGRIEWPADLLPGLPTLGMASEVRAVLARSRELGLDPADLARLGRESGRPVWSAIGELAQEVASATALHNVADYTDLLRMVINLLCDPDLPRPVFDAIYVDEYQDTDPLQVQLLQALCAPGTSVVAVGDPDQAIYGFRGADRDGLLRFRRQFRTDSGELAPVAVLDRTRRFGSQIREIATAAIAHQGLPPDLRAAATRHRVPLCEGESRVEARVYDSSSALSAHVAEQLRQAHLHEAMPWSDMAIIVRAAHQIAPLERALALAGVPVQVSIDEVPLHREPAVATLLLALNAALPGSSLTPAQAVELVSGPLGGLDPADLRTITRALRARMRQLHPAHPLPTSDETVRAALADPELLDGLDDVPAGRTLRSLGALLASARALIEQRRGPEDVLWLLWNGTPWPRRLRQRALRGSASADHDLDAVIALFETAERVTDRYAGQQGVRNFIETLRAQQIPAEQVSGAGAEADRVRILTAHRSKGLEWRFVVVTGLQEGAWPDIRPRGSVLHADRLTADGVGHDGSLGAVLAEEERLFYVAITRARERLLIAAVGASTDSADPPSRFLDRLPVPVTEVAGRPPRRSSLPGLVAELRSVAQDPAASAGLRQAAVSRLALLADASSHGGPLVPSAHPDSWWALHELTDGAAPVRPADQPVRLSASAVESLHRCGLQWFLDRQAKVHTSSGAKTVFGKVVHAIVDHIAKGNVPADIDHADALVDTVWRQLDFDAQFTSVQQRAEARDALQRYLVYHNESPAQVIATEADFTVLFDGDVEQVTVTGFLDRVERDSAGALRPIDIKTNAKLPSANEVAEHVQLLLYQWAVRQGAFAEYGATPGGAALVQLRHGDRGGSTAPKVQEQAPLDDDGVARVEGLLIEAALRVRVEDFSAEPGGHCRFCSFTSICPSGPGQVVR